RVLLLVRGVPAAVRADAVLPGDHAALHVGRGGDLGAVGALVGRGALHRAAELSVAALDPDGRGRGRARAVGVGRGLRGGAAPALGPDVDRRLLLGAGGLAVLLLGGLLGLVVAQPFLAEPDRRARLLAARARLGDLLVLDLLLVGQPLLADPAGARLGVA